MLININKNLILLLFSASGLVFFGMHNFALAKNSSANVESNVSATANTGGNKIEGSGSIKTGSASASAKSVNIVNSDGENSVKAEVKAEANGESVEANYEGSGPADIREESSDGNSSAEIKVDNENANDAKDINNTSEPPKSFFEKVWNFVKSIF